MAIHWIEQPTEGKKESHSNSLDSQPIRACRVAVPWSLAY
jgi:hypothetical protein